MTYRRDSNRDSVLGRDTVNEIAKHSTSTIKTDAGGRATTKKDNVAGLRKIQLPSYQEGTPLIPEDQIAQLHEGEAVIPKEENPNATSAPAEQLIAPPVAVKSEKERARQQVENPGAQTIAMSAPATDEAEIQRKAIDVDRKQGAGQGASGLVKMGLANIHEDQLAVPKEFARPTEVSSAVGMPRIETPASSVVSPETLALIPGTPDNRASKAGLKPIGGAAPSYKQTVADYRARIQAELDKATPEGQERADRLSNAMQEYMHANPWGSAQNRPGILGKLGHIASRIGNIAGDVVAPGTMALIPGTDMNKAIRHGNTLGRIQAETPLTTAREAEQSKETPGPKLLSGEGNIATAPDGTRYQRYEMPGGATAWAKEGEVPAATPAAPLIAPRGAEGLPQIAATPTSGGLPQGAVIGKPAGDKAETREQHLNRYAELKNQQESGAALNDADQKDFNTLKTELTVSPATVAAYNKQIDSTLKAANVDQPLWSNYHVLPGATSEEAKQAIADAKAFSGETYQQGTEGRKEDAETRAQERKDKATTGYAETEDGQTVLASKFDQQNGIISSGPLKGTKLVGTFEEAKPGEISKDRQAIRVLNDVQKNVSVYDKAIKNDLPKVSDEDRRKMQEVIALNEDTGGAAVSIGEKGISISSLSPVVSAKIKATALEQARADLKNMSPAARNMLTAYLRTATSVVAYQKAVTGSARANELQLQLELANIPAPYFDADTAASRLGAFQDNVSLVSNGYPKNLPGVRHPSELRKQLEREGEAPAGATNPVFDRDGHTVIGHVVNGKYVALGK